MNGSWQDKQWKTLRKITDPFEDGEDSLILDTIIARIAEVPGGPEEIVYRGIVVLKRLAAQYVEDLDALTGDVAHIWSNVEGHHHTSRLKVFHITKEEVEREQLLEQLMIGWMCGFEIPPLQDLRPDLRTAWEERERDLESQFGDSRRELLEIRKRNGLAQQDGPEP